MIVPDYVAPIIALMAAAVVTLILVLPVAALVTIADRILALRVAALVNIADPFFKGLFFSRKDRTPDVDQDVARTGADALQGVPDYVAPIVGWRAWKWDPPQLTSINNQSAWYPGQPMKAKCAGGAWATRTCPLPGHEPADKHCTCGIYAAKTLDRLYAMGYARSGLYGEVYLWGRVVEHTHGWRAQFAYPKSLRFSLILGRNVGSHMGALTAYGADIYLGDTLLWTKQRGYTRRGRILLRFIQLRCSLFELESKWFLPPFSTGWTHRLGSPTSVFYLTALAYLTCSWIS